MRGFAAVLRGAGPGGRDGEDGKGLRVRRPSGRDDGDLPRPRRVVVSRTAGMPGPVRRRSTVAPWCGSGIYRMVTPGPAAGGFPARPGGKDHRRVLTHAVHPRPSHASDAAADPPVGVAGASVFPPGRPTGPAPPATMWRSRSRPRRGRRGAPGVSSGAPGRRVVAPVPADGAAPPSPPTGAGHRHPPRGRA